MTTVAAKIRLAFVDTEAPPVYHRSDPDTGERRGYEPEAAGLICAEAGLALEWVPLPWDDMIPAVRAGTVDAVWCGQGVIPERAELVDFTEPYAAFRDALVLRAEHAARAPHDLAGLKIAVIAGSANLNFLRGFAGVTPVEFGSSDDVLGDMMESARRGDTDGFVDDDAVMAPFVSGDPDFVLAVVGEVLHPWAAGVAPGNDALRLRLNAARHTVVADGRLAAIWRAWMPQIPFPFAVQADAPALWSAQAQMPTVLGRQLEIVRGEAEYVFTSDGHRLFDAPAGLWYANVGHGRPELAEAAYEQMRRLETFHLFGRFTNDRAIELAERLAGLSPIPEPKVILTSGGSDSIDLSAKLARRYWQAVGQGQRTVMLSRDSGYHGLHAYGTSLVGIEANREGLGTDSLVPETSRVDRDDLAVVARQIEAIGGDRIAALVVEPVIGAGGVFPPASGYLTGLRELADRHGFLLIADEVVTGFGRVGEWFASARFGFAPDMLVFAKGVTSGYAPLGGLLVSPRVAAPFYAGPDAPIFRHGLTYSGHATAAAVALANLDVIERDGLLTRARELETVILAQLDALRGNACIAATRAIGVMAGVELLPAIDAYAVADAMIARGQIARVLPGNTIQLSPPLTTSYAQLDEFLGVLVECAERVG